MAKAAEKSTKGKSKVQKTTKKVKEGKTIKDTVKDKVINDRSLTILPENIKLTPKQSLFVDYYLESFNATQSYIKAYYPNKEIKVADREYNRAKTEGCTLLTKPNVRKKIEEGKQLLKNNAIADIHEVNAFITSVMRGEVPDQLGFETSVRDRMAAAKIIKERWERLDEITDKGDTGKNEPKKIEITVIDNSDLEAAMYNAANDSKIVNKKKGSVKNGRIK